MLGLAICLGSRELGARRVPGLASALLGLTMPVVFRHVDTMLVDLPLAAFFMTSP